MRSHTIRNRSLTSGSIPGSILLFALPLFLGQLLQQFYNMADAWVIGNFASNNAFAAVRTDSVHAVVPITRAHKRQTVRPAQLK